MNIKHSEKIVLLGGSGFVGQAFLREICRRGIECLSLSRSVVDYTAFSQLRAFLSDYKPSFLINCAGYTGKPNVDACEANKEATLLGNVCLPMTIADVCESLSISWGQVSSGCIYVGAKLRQKGQPERIEKDLMAPPVKSQWEADPSILHGFDESDVPNFSFDAPPCSFYSGTKALGETVLAGRQGVYIWRLRIPFDGIDSPRNYLTKIQSYSRVYDNVNSLSHRGDFVCACLDSWAYRTPFGIYNITNPGWVTTRMVVNMLTKKLKAGQRFEFFLNDEDFYRSAVTPRSNTILNSEKLLSVGVRMRCVEDALEESISVWR